MSEDRKEIRSDAARLLGTAKSEKKAAASTRNLETARAARAANVLPCDCGRTDGTHRNTCPVYRREAWRKYQERSHKPASD